MNMKNSDGTVNLEGVKNHVEFIKGKYAQNAKNYKANTGKEMSFGKETTNQDEEASRPELKFVDNKDEKDEKAPIEKNSE